MFLNLAISSVITTQVPTTNDLLNTLQVPAASDTLLTSQLPPTPEPDNNAAPENSTVTYEGTYFESYRPINALDMVLLLPGFTFENATSARGLGDASGNVLVNGAQPASKVDPLSQILSRIPANSVLRIDVIRGADSDVDLRGKAIVANIILKNTDKTMSDITASIIGSTKPDVGGLVQYHGTTKINNIDFETSIRVARFLDDTSGGGSRIRSNDLNAGNFETVRRIDSLTDSFKGTLAASSPFLGGKLDANTLLIANRPTTLQTDDFTIGNAVQTDSVNQRVRRSEIGLRYEKNLTNKLKSELYFLQQFGSLQNTNDFTSDEQASNITGSSLSSQFVLDRRTKESIGRLTLKWNHNDTFDFEFGSEASYNSLKNRTTFVADNVTIDLPAANVNVTEFRRDFFGNIITNYNKNLTINTGLSLEQSEIKSTGEIDNSRKFSFLKPRVSTDWRIDDNNQLRLELRRRVDQLMFSDFTAQTIAINTDTVAAGNPDLNPERAWQFETEWERKLGKHGSATVRFQHENLTDVIDRIPVLSSTGTFDSPGNIGDGTKNEAEFGLNIGTELFGLNDGRLSGALILRSSSVIDPTTGDEREISRLHRSDWEIHFTKLIPSYNLEFGFDLFGKTKETSFVFNEVRIDRVGQNNRVFVKYNHSKDLNLRLDLLNISRRSINQTRTRFDGLRNETDSLLFIENNTIKTDPFIRFQIFKTF